MQTQENVPGHRRNIRLEATRLNPGSSTELKHSGLDLNNYGDLLGEQAVEQAWGIKHASLKAIIDLPVRGTLAVADQESFGRYADRRDAMAIYCFLGSAPGEPPKYYFLSRDILAANLQQPIDELGIPALEKGHERVIGRGAGNMLPGREYDENGVGSHPDFAFVSAVTSRKQGLVAVTDEGHFEVWDLGSRGGTSVMHGSLEVTPAQVEVENELGAASLADVVEQQAPDPAYDRLFR